MKKTLFVTLLTLSLTFSSFTVRAESSTLSIVKIGELGKFVFQLVENHHHHLTPLDLAPMPTPTPIEWQRQPIFPVDNYW